MIVLDASAAIEWLLTTPAGLAIEARIFARGETLHAPHLIDLEVSQVVKRYVTDRIISATRGEEALADLADLRLHRYPHTPFLRRIWQLRRNLSAYDASYVALSESLAATLLTRDRKIASAPGHRARVELF